MDYVKGIVPVDLRRGGSPDVQRIAPSYLALRRETAQARMIIPIESSCEEYGSVVAHNGCGAPVSLRIVPFVTIQTISPLEFTIVAECVDIDRAFIWLNVRIGSSVDHSVDARC
jgi:hypothetical protein